MTLNAQLAAERQRPTRDGNHPPADATIEQLMQQLIHLIATTVCDRRGIHLDRTRRRRPVKRGGITVWEDTP